MNDLEERLEDITTALDVAIIGCVVNGPGEAKAVDVGLTGGSPNNLLYLDGKPGHKLVNENLVDSLERTIREKVRLKDEENSKLIVKT